MLESHNDSAVILAEYLGESVSGFAAKMNEKAREIGCTDTWFITPNGLDAQEEVQGEVEKASYHSRRPGKNHAVLYFAVP